MNCRRCHQPITERWSGYWVHADDDLSRGCRAATFDPESGWDNSIPKWWTAKP